MLWKQLSWKQTKKKNLFKQCNDNKPLNWIVLGEICRPEWQEQAFSLLLKYTKHVQREIWPPECPYDCISYDADPTQSEIEFKAK